jgi:hypothetical protein
MPYKDPEKAKAAKRRYALEHRERIAAAQVARRSLLRQHIAKAKDRPCMDCDIHYPSYIMDFDHVRGTKGFSISAELHSKCFTLAKLQEEIDKCDVVCANCHRHRTWMRKTEVSLIVEEP